MKSFTFLSSTILGLTATLAFGAVPALRGELTTRSVEGRIELLAPEVKKRQGCTNGPTSRNCWSAGFDVNTDSKLPHSYPRSITNKMTVYTSWPNTGRTVSVRSSQVYRTHIQTNTA